MKSAVRVQLVLPLLPLLFLLVLATSSESDVEPGGPYHFGGESYRHWARTPHGRFKVLRRFSDRSALLEGVDRYRLAVLEAAPRSFLLPSHYNSDELFYVIEGEGVLTLLWRGRSESYCIKEGDVMLIPAGAIAYSANTQSGKNLRVAMLLDTVSTPGRFEEFFPVRGDNPESFFGAFSDEVIQAAFNARREQWGRVFEREGTGEIIRASEKQIQELSRSCSRGGGGSRSPSEEAIRPYSITEKKPRYSNSHGKLYEVTPGECPELQNLDVEVVLANITRGSMMAPSYSTRATKIAIVLQGSGYFEMASPQVSGESEGRERGRGKEWSRGEGEDEEEEEREQGQKRRGYKQVKSRIGEGSVVVIPAGYPTAVVAGNEENLQLLCFGVRAAYDEKVFLAGRNSLLREMADVAKELAFSATARQVDQVMDAQPEAVFFRGPEARGRGGASTM